MIDYQHLTPERIAAACESAMRACDDAVAAIVATPAAQRTFANTFVALESAADIVHQASGHVRVHGVRRRTTTRCARRRASGTRS